MMDWTDRHCRVFHRQISQRALLYTEMLTADAVRFGDRQHLLGFDEMEHPVALQLGGSDPKGVAEAALIGADFGYDEINLNCGCPSDRVQSGSFGACLMAEPDLVADCVAAMKRAVDVPVTVKCRIGIDDQDSEIALPRFVTAIADAGVDGVIVHARKAWLKGLSPKENRDVPPLDYELVMRLKDEWPNLPISLNGGIADLAQAQSHLRHFDGVMLGRAAYQTPYCLADVDRQIFGVSTPPMSRSEIVHKMQSYVTFELAKGTSLIAISRHMLGLYHGQPGGRHWRRILSEEGRAHDAGWEIFKRALETVERHADAANARETHTFVA